MPDSKVPKLSRNILSYIIITGTMPINDFSALDRLEESVVCIFVFHSKYTCMNKN